MRSVERMSADIIETPATSRDYTVPAAVVASVTAALQLPDITHHDKDLAERLAAQTQVTVDDVMRIHTSPRDAGYELRGGDAGYQWAERIVDGIVRDLDSKQEQTLTRFEFDPKSYVYAGVTSSEDEDLITQVIRFPAEDTGVHNAEALTAHGWRKAVFDFSGEDQNTHAVGLDAELFAFTASAFIDDDVYGVYLAYTEPHTFLDDKPLLASAPLTPVDAEGHVYAIVDNTDTTAVIDLIMIKRGAGERGATVYRRNGGTWQLDEPMLDVFMSPNPPPIVELSGEAQARIISQVDANTARQVMVTEEGGQPGINALTVKTQKAAKANNAWRGKQRSDLSPPKPVETTIESRRVPGAPNPPENRDKRTPEDSEEGPNSRPPVTAAGIRHDYGRMLAEMERRYHADREQATRHYYTDDGYQQGYSLTAALAQSDYDVIHRTNVLRSHALRSAQKLRDEMMARQIELEQVVLPALTAASAAGNEPFVHDKPGQRQAENLRIYWTRGKGAAKIRWGTKGSFTRCVRQLRKYLGARTEGYCANRHKEVEGKWPGEHRYKH